MLVQDVMVFMSKSDTHTFLESRIIRPLLERIFRSMYPYLVGILVLWILMFACLAVILLLVLGGRK